MNTGSTGLKIISSICAALNISMNIKKDNPKTGGIVQAISISVKNRLLNSLEVIR